MPVPSGVIQGSVLGPLLFIIFMLDLAQAINSPHAFYADDSTVYKNVSCLQDQAALQEDLRSIELWCHNNRMKLNVSKCTHARITRSSAPIPTSFEVCGEAIPTQEKFKLLGIWITGDLRWNHHTEVVRSRAMRILGMLTRSFQAKSVNALRVIYLTMVRSILTFGTPAWHPTSKSNLDKLERVQGRATRLILGYKKTAPESAATRLSRCKLPSISDYLDRVDIKFLSKCLSGTCNFQLFRTDRASIRSRRPGLRGGESLLTHPKANSNSYLTSLHPCCVAALLRIGRDSSLCNYPLLPPLSPSTRTKTTKQFSPLILYFIILY